MPSAEISVYAPTPSKQLPGVSWSEFPQAKYPIQSANWSVSWGSSPGEANLVYVSESPITLGSAVKARVGPYLFYGVTEACEALTSSRGNNWSLRLLDMRRYLSWDQIYSSFNNIDDRILNDGTRISRARRYWHILPNDFPIMRKTWTADTYSPIAAGSSKPALEDLRFGRPFTAAEILTLIMNGPGIGTPWRFGYMDTSGVLHQPTVETIDGNQVTLDAFHPNMSIPIYGLDALNGKDFGVVLQEICKELGLLFTLMPTDTNPFLIVFAQKGVDGPDVDPTTIPNANYITVGTELSGNPTRVRVLGDRNLYEVHDITMVPDWNVNWNRFYDFDLFRAFVLEHFITWNSIADPEMIAAQQDALSLALEMTMAQFDARAHALGLSTAGYWLDYRKYGGRSRLNMPCALYIRNLLFRSFRLPDNFWFRNTYNATIDQYCVEIQDKLLTRVTHDPITGLTQSDPTKSVDGNCYVVIRGYQVGKDMFATIRPERFNIASWTSAQAIWQHIEARIEDGGDPLSTSLVFDEPVIKSANLVSLIDGYGVFNAVPTIEVPDVRATLTFAAEKFSWFQTEILDPTLPPEDPIMGIQVNDAVLNVNGLNGEFVITPSASAEIPYCDGKYCRMKAIENANNYLRFQYINSKGQFTVPFEDSDTAFYLHGKCDRITISHSPQGSTAQVHLANERQRINYVPERELDRLRDLNTLLPGQEQAVKEAGFAKKISAAVKTNKDAYALLSSAFHGNFAQPEKAKQTFVTVNP